MGFNERIPVDMQIVIALVLLSDIFIFVLPDSAISIRAALGLPFILFLPGYVSISALFPGRDDLEGLERLALSLGLSIVIVPFIGFGLNYSPWGIRLEPLAVILSLYILLMCIMTLIRRHRLPQGEAFSMNLSSVFDSLRLDASSQRSGLDRKLTIILLVSIVISAATLAYVMATPREGEQFTEFYILGENGTAADYPSSLEAGESGTVIVGVQNHEGETVDYTLKLQLDNRSLPLEDGIQDIQLEDDGKWENPVTFTPEDVGEDMKLEFLLYKNDDLTVPYRELHIWINVAGD